MPAFSRIVIAAVIVALGSAVFATREAVARNPVIVSEGVGAGVGHDPGACGCRSVQRPPWHASVGMPACGPACHPRGTMFHADPHGQLCVRRQLHETGATMPSLFPRLNTLCTEGFMPTPRPLALPRCHHCGMPIEHGL